VAGHRRHLPSRAFRGFEMVAWITGATLVTALLAYVFMVAPPARPGLGAAQNLAPAVPVNSGPCVFEPCSERPMPTGPPTRVRITAIGVDTPLVELKLDARGQLEAPKTYGRPGWFRDGVVPGDAGPAVVAGHVDSKDGPAVFYDLHTLRPGDTIEIERGGEWVAFAVTTIERYPKNRFPTEKVYQPTPGAELRVITCGGDFDPNRLSYRDNVVVYAVLA
jgi:hypothetical protein